MKDNSLTDTSGRQFTQGEDHLSFPKEKSQTTAADDTFKFIYCFFFLPFFIETKF